MPQLPGPLVRDRAAMLRAAGAAALAGHLAAQVGTTQRVLTEGPHLGRCEDFTEVAFADAQPEGQLVTVDIVAAGISGLIAARRASAA